ncbi:hypothetical protein KDK95_17090 [Actinospica sp. MGRD01-02]|uniref:Uncharacterized protein n=1 Tax=Actinospica acidithermotolerans TaxID=2828514 RepID=A0A941E822_9ACTN|nr:hypothetical protein [Actinospica acidithermotolerans]MBR7828035.1 hypothetical protein [Actinospica acidithermotolerans]
MTDMQHAHHPPSDLGESYDPFRATHPTVLVHDTSVEVFERAWDDSDSRCPQCRRGTAAERGTAPLDQRRWVRFTCGDVIAVEHTAG